MRSKLLDLDRYKTDKISNQYLEFYDPVFSPLVDKEIKLLELGIKEGASLLLWRDYFPRATISGIDCQIPANFSPGERIQMFQGNQEDTEFLSSVAQQMAAEGFDVIIDDASHVGESTRKSFWHLFDHHLKPGGIYVIEDWGTGYWDDWQDGSSYHPRSPFALFCLKVWRRLGFISRISHHTHSYGMVGFVKELVDEQGASDLSRHRLSEQPGRQSRFASLVIAPSLVFVTKAATK